MNTDIFELRESKTLELKKTIPQKKQLIKTCVAFANGSGGEIVIGIEDKTQKILGVTQNTRDKIFEEISSSIFDSIAPNVIPEVFEKNVSEKTIVFIKIYPGNKPPYFVKKEGSKKGVYLRVGSSTRRASEEYIEELYRQQQNIYFDEQSSSVPLKELDTGLLEEVYSNRSNENLFLMDKVAVRDVRNRKKMMATHAGLLFFTNNPEQYIPESMIICTHFKGRSGRNIIRTIEITGPIPSLVKATLKLLESWIERNLEITKHGKLQGHLPIPREALREAVINALIHRKYFIPGAIKIALYDDRLEIFSPGSLPGLISTQSLGDGTTFLRNPTIAKLARKYRLVEKLGSGVKLIFGACKKLKLKRPIYNEDGDFVKLTFFFEKELDEDLSDEEKIIQLAINLKKLKIRDLTQRIELSRNTATRRMNTLIEKGLFERRGKGPGTYFIYKGEEND